MASDWQSLYRLADATGTADNTVTQVRGLHPSVEFTDNGGAQARCLHDEEFEGIVLSDGTRVALDTDY